MKRLIPLILILGCSSEPNQIPRGEPSQSKGPSIQYFKTGMTPNQILVRENTLYTVDSGFMSEPSLTRIDRSSGEVQIFSLPKGTNPYRAIFDGDRLLMTFNLTDELVSVPLSTSSLQPTRLFQPSLETKGAESVALQDGYLWLSFSNLDKDFKYKEGEIFRFNPDDFDIGPIERIKLGAKNPKSIVPIEARKLAVATGDYQKDDGQILILEVLGDRTEIESIDVGGTPSALFYDGVKLWACEQDWPADAGDPGVLYEIHTGSHEVIRHELPFPTCANVYVNARWIIVTHLNGGDEGAPKEHLYVLNRKDLSVLASVELLPEGTPSPSRVFPSDLKPLRDGKIAVSLSEINHLAIVSIERLISR